MGCEGCSMSMEESRPATLTAHDWLKELPDTSHISKIVEIRFKGNHKDFFINEDDIPVKIGDPVVVATSPGHDVGYVSLTGTLAKKQFERKIKSPGRHKWNKIYRVATIGDKERWEEAKKREYSVMIRARQIAAELGLEMKVGDVEFRGDGAKAIFYYIAEKRVDFRELIKLYAREFRIKIEMKQIGARQEAGMVGGIGSCGRELCCSSWRTDFSSVTSNAAIKQGLSPSAGKMAGQCGKLKCCLMYELDSYLDAQKDFPVELLTLETENGIAKHFKTDILSKKIWYTIDEGNINKPFVLNLKDVKAIIQLNKRGKQPAINKYIIGVEAEQPLSMDVGSVDIDLMEKKKKRPAKNYNKKRRRKPNNYRKTSKAKA